MKAWLTGECGFLRGGCDGFMGNLSVNESLAEVRLVTSTRVASLESFTCVPLALESKGYLR